MKKSIIYLVFVIQAVCGYAQDDIVYIPDSNFKDWLINRDFINTNGDNEIQLSEADVFTGTIGCHSSFTWGDPMTDATGLEAFVNITSVNFSGHSLQYLDLSPNTYVTNAIVDYGELIELDISGNINLEILFADHNNLSELDMSNNQVLDIMHVGDNNLTQVNLANGNNVNMSWVGLINNPNLTCVQIDPGFVVPQPSGETTGWWYDDYSVFSEDCWQDLSVGEAQQTNGDIQLYPNPVKEVLYVRATVPIQEIKIYDMQASLIKSVKFQEEISLQGLTKGIYMVHIVTARGIFTEKIVKE